MSQSLTLAAGLTVDRVEVTVDIAHTWIGDLEVILVSPDGTESVLTHRPGQNINTRTGYGLNSDNITFTFSSNAFWGEQGNGRWTLKVNDLQAGDKGTLKSWSMKVYGDETGADDLYVYTDEFGRFGAEAARQVLRDANGGLDTLNAAALTGSLVLDLREGAASTIAQRSVTIAQGSVIENAIAGDAADLLIGNAAANRLQGMRGNDRLEGGSLPSTVAALSRSAGSVRSTPS